MFSGKKLKKEYPLMALVTESPYRNVSFAFPHKASLLDLYNREVSLVLRKCLFSGRFTKEKTLFCFSKKAY